MAFAEVIALKIVDFPTFGKPTIPQLKPIGDFRFSFKDISTNA
jgi:hypothetical protein